MNGYIYEMETLKLRKISVDTYRENVAYLHRDCPVYRSEGFQALSKIEIHKTGDGAPVIAVPTSVGYGVGQGGRLSLDSALGSCAPGIVTVNIDNGFGAATLVHRIAPGKPTETP